jgi:hypothetical protein
VPVQERRVRVELVVVAVEVLHATTVAMRT